MARYDLREPVKGVSTGQRIVPLGSDNNKELEERISTVENKLDKILNLLENKKENIKNDKNMVYANIDIYAQCTLS